MTVCHSQSAVTLTLTLVSDVTQSDCRVSPEPVGLFRICTTHWLHSRSNRLLNLLAYFVFSTLSVAVVPEESDARKRSLPHQTPLLTPFCACAQPTAFHACVNYFNLVVSVFSVQFILFLRQSLCMCIVL